MTAMVLVRSPEGLTPHVILDEHDEGPLVIIKSPHHLGEPGYLIIHAPTGARLFERPYDFLSQARVVRDTLLAAADWRAYTSTAAMRTDVSLHTMAVQVSRNARRGLLR